MRRESLRVSFENENEKIAFSKFLTLGTNTFVFLARKFCAFLKIKKRKKKEEKEKWVEEEGEKNWRGGSIMYDGVARGDGTKPMRNEMMAPWGY